MKDYKLKQRNLRASHTLGWKSSIPFSIFACHPCATSCELFFLFSFLWNDKSENYVKDLYMTRWRCDERLKDEGDLQVSRGRLFYPLSCCLLWNDKAKARKKTYVYECRVMKDEMIYTPHVFFSCFFFLFLRNHKHVRTWIVTCRTCRTCLNRALIEP
jgi:hypothetical protein